MQAAKLAGSTGLLGLAALVFASCSKPPPAYCEAMKPVALGGKVHQQAAALRAALGKLGAPKGSSIFEAFEESLARIERSTNRHYTTASARPLAEDLERTAAAWRRVVAYDCGGKAATTWEQEVGQLRAALGREAAENEKGHAAAEARAAAEAKERDRARNQHLTRCREAAVTRIGKRIPTAATHYSRSGGKRGAIAYFRLKGNLWVGDEPRFLDDEPGAVKTQGDVVFTRETGKCVDMPDDAGGKRVIRKVCGWHSDVITCDLTTGAILAATQIVLPPPQELKVRGSLLESAARHLGTQLGSKLDALSWR